MVTATKEVDDLLGDGEGRDSEVEGEVAGDVEVSVVRMEGEQTQTVADNVEAQRAEDEETPPEDEEDGVGEREEGVLKKPAASEGQPGDGAQNWVEGGVPSPSTEDASSATSISPSLGGVGKRAAMERGGTEGRRFTKRALAGQQSGVTGVSARRAGVVR